MQPHTFTRRVSSPAGLRPVRAELADWLSDAGATASERDAIVLACWEAAANALEHPRGGDSQVDVAAEDHEGHVVLSVTDRGRWREQRAGRPGRGLGLGLMEALMDDVQIVPSVSGTRVVMCRCLHETSRGEARTNRALPARS